MWKNLANWQIVGYTYLPNFTRQLFHFFRNTTVTKNNMNRLSFN